MTNPPSTLKQQLAADFGAEWSIWESLSEGGLPTSRVATRKRDLTAAERAAEMAPTLMADSWTGLRSQLEIDKVVGEHIATGRLCHIDAAAAVAAGATGPCCPPAAS